MKNVVVLRKHFQPYIACDQFAGSVDCRCYAVFHFVKSSMSLRAERKSHKDACHFIFDCNAVIMVCHLHIAIYVSVA